MENTFNYDSVPAKYPHCFNHSCVKSDKCMYHLVAMHCTTLHYVIYTINPVCIPEDTANCPYFHPIRKMRMAWGIKHLLDNVPHKDAAELKSQMISYFGRTMYYRIYREEHGLTIEQQDFIRRLFHKKGIVGEPAFERYSDEYIWQK